MEQTSLAVERTRLLVVILLRMIAAAALIHGLWLAGIWLSWGMYDQNLFNGVYMQTWIIMGLSVVLGGGILLNVDWLICALVPETFLSSNSFAESQHDTHGEMAAVLTLAAVRFAGGALIVYGLWMLGSSILALIPSSQSPPQKIGWIVAGYLIPIVFLVVAGLLIIVYDRRLALWLRSDWKPSDLSPSDHSA